MVVHTILWGLLAGASLFLPGNVFFQVYSSCAPGQMSILLRLAGSLFA